MRDWRPKLTGQGTYGPLRLPRLKGPMHLWNHVAPPPAQNTLVVMKDGSVREGNQMPHEALYGPDVYRLFVGGYDHRCTPETDPFAFDALGRAGYSCCHPLEDVYPGATGDYYPADDVFPEKGSC